MISNEKAEVSLDKSKGLIWEKRWCCRGTGRLKRQQRECCSFSGQIEGGLIWEKHHCCRWIGRDWKTERGMRSWRNDGLFRSTDDGLFCGADQRADLFEAMLEETCEGILDSVDVQKLAKFGGLTNGRRKVMAK